MRPAVSRAAGREGIRPAKDETAAGVASGAAACEPESTPPNIVAVPATTTAASRRRSLLPKRRPLLFELAVPGNPFSLRSPVQMDPIAPVPRRREEREAVGRYAIVRVDAVGGMGVDVVRTADHPRRDVEDVVERAPPVRPGGRIRRRGAVGVVRQRTEPLLIRK